MKKTTIAAALLCSLLGACAGPRPIAQAPMPKANVSAPPAYELGLPLTEGGGEQYSCSAATGKCVAIPPVSIR